MLLSCIVSYKVAEMLCEVLGLWLCPFVNQLWWCTKCNFLCGLRSCCIPISANGGGVLPRTQMWGWERVTSPSHSTLLLHQPNTVEAKDKWLLQGIIQLTYGQGHSVSICAILHWYSLHNGEVTACSSLPSLPFSRLNIYSTVHWINELLTINSKFLYF